MIDTQHVERLLNIGAVSQSLDWIESRANPLPDAVISNPRLQILFVRSLRLSGQPALAQMELRKIDPDHLPPELKTRWQYERDFIALSVAEQRHRVPRRQGLVFACEDSCFQLIALQLWYYCANPEKALPRRQNNSEFLEAAERLPWLATFVRDYEPYFSQQAPPILNAYGFHEQLAFAVSCPQSDCRVVMFAALAFNAAFHGRELEIRQNQERYQMECLALSSGRTLDLYNLFGKSELALEELTLGWKRFFKKVKIAKDILLLSYMQKDARKKRHQHRILQTAQRLSHHFWAVKGPSMKLHQIADPILDFFPDEVRTIYHKSSHVKPSLTPARALKVIEAELGRPVGDVFSYVSEYPIASASVAQVHKAILRTGEPVAVKVQYPEIPSLMRKKSLSWAALAPFVRVVFPALNTRELRSFIQQQYTMELDFRREQAFMERARVLLADEELVKIPRSYPQWTTSRILTMEYIDGLHPLSAKALEGNDEQVNQLSAAVIRSLHRLLYKHHLCYPDAHPDNVIFKDKVAYLIDFGSCQPVSASLIQLNQGIYRAVYERDKHALANRMVDSGWLLRSSEDILEAMYEFVETQMRHVMGRPNLIDSERYLAELLQRARKLVRHTRIPMEQLVVMRFAVLCHAYLLEVKPEFDWHGQLHGLMYDH